MLKAVRIAFTMERQQERIGYSGGTGSSFLTPWVQVVYRQVMRIEARKAGKGEILKRSISNSQDFELYPDGWETTKDLIRGMIIPGVDNRKITAGRLNMTCTGRETIWQREGNQEVFRD